MTTLISTSNSPDWNNIEALSLLSVPTKSGNHVILHTSAGNLLLEINNLGVRLYSEVQRDHDYGLLVNKPTAMSIQLQSNENSTVVTSDTLTVNIAHQPLAFEVIDQQNKTCLKSPTDGHFVRRHRVPPIAKIEQGWLLSWALKSGEPIYGLGEKWGALNKRGQLIRSYNHDALGVNAEISYKNTPFCWSPEGWGVFFHTPSAVIHSLGFADWSQRSYCALLEDEILDLYLFSAPRSLDLIQAYTELTGKAPMPPIWSGGVILSKAYYQDADEILAVAKQVRDKKMPCDVITFDGRAWQDTDTRFAFEWCPKRYPNPSKVMAELKELDFKVCIWEYPLISVKHKWFDEFADKGWLLTDKRTGKAYQYEWDQQAFGKVLTPLPNSGIVDFTHPDAYAFWRDAHKPLFDLGVDMIKADFGEQVEDDNMLASNGESGLALHNVYSHLYNRCVYEAAERYCKSGPFLFSRSAWTGSQRFNSQWGGDPQADWEGMIGNIRGGLSWGLSGAPFYATDIGGFYKDTRDDALYVRWAQAGLFSAHFRLHGIGEREPWSYSSEAEQAVDSVLKLRYRLQAYLRKTMQQAVDHSLPVQRPMVIAYPEEKQAWAFENQFMFGDDLLVVPCFDPDGHVEFYLPEGHWFLFDPELNQPQQEVLIGQKVYKRKLALNEMAVFAKSGVQIELCEAVEYTDQLGDDLPINDVWKATSNN